MSLDSNSGTVDKSRHQCALTQLSEHMQAHRFVHVCVCVRVWAHLCVHTHSTYDMLKELTCCLGLEHLLLHH